MSVRQPLRIVPAAVAVVLALTLTTLVPAPSSAVVPPVVPEPSLQSFASGFSSPLLVTHAGDGSGRVFVVEQTGQVHVVDGDGNVAPGAFLDVSHLVRCCGERGLLGLAFAPDYATSGRLYLSYTDTTGTSTLARYVVADPTADVASVVSTEILFLQSQPFPNHNGGHLAFGPDGMLYLALGDGGAGGDPHNNGQNTETYLGALLRFDVSGATGYTVPADNPFVGGPGLDLIWAYGLRNPWRFSFDRDTGDLWVADVGQNREEEVNRVAASSQGGENYGWRVYEGNSVFDGSQAQPDDQFTMTWPVATYSHALGCSVTGGHVYRGAHASSVVDTYLFGDFCTGRIWTLTGAANQYVMDEAMDTGHGISSFGEDEDGELYLTDLFTGRVMRIVWTPGLL